MQSFEELRKKARNRLLQMHYESNAGHIGGNLSCLDILLYLHHYVMKPEDIFILSKGHAAGALYITLWTLGKITDDELKTFHKDGGLCGHITAKHGTFATGSLGHGLSLAVGLELGKRRLKDGGKVYCLLSDGELQEGSTQEALIFMRNHIENLIVIIDGNKWQGFEACHSSHRWGGDGHSFDDLEVSFKLIQPIIYFNTVKGYGTPLENTLESHYLPLTAEQYAQSLR